MINLLNLPALRPQSHVLRQGPCSFRQSWNPAVSSCPSLQCSGKVTCHDSHHVSETISMMQAGFEGQPKPWKYPKHWVTSRHSMPATQAGRPLQQKKTKPPPPLGRPEVPSIFSVPSLQNGLVPSSGLLIGSIVDTSCHEKFSKSCGKMMICFIYCTY